MEIFHCSIWLLFASKNKKGEEKKDEDEYEESFIGVARGGFTADWVWHMVIERQSIRFE